MEEIKSPYSLFASAMEEVSKCYRFSPQDALSFVKGIDYYPVAVGRHSTSDFAVSCYRNIPPPKRKRLYSSVKRFLTKRRNLMDVLCDALAKSIVYFESKADVDDLNLSKLRAKYVKYSNLLEKIEKAGVDVYLEDNIQMLLGYVQEERAKTKQINMFVNLAKYNPVGLVKHRYYSTVGDGETGSCSTIGGWDYNALPAAYHAVGGSDSISGICENENKNATENITIENLSTVRGQHGEENDGDEIMFNGMICA